MVDSTWPTEQVPLCLEAYNFEVQGHKALNLCFWVAFLMISKCTNIVGKSFSVLEIWPLKITKNVALNDFRRGVASNNNNMTDK